MAFEDVLKKISNNKFPRKESIMFYLPELQPNLKLLEQKFNEAFDNNSFDWDNIFKTFFANEEVVSIFKESFKDSSYKKLESFIEKHKKQRTDLSQQEIDVLLESAVVNSTLFKLFRRFFINKLLKSPKVVEKNLKNLRRTFTITWKGRLLECEKYFEQHLKNLYKASKEAVKK